MYKNTPRNMQHTGAGTFQRNAIWPRKGLDDPSTDLYRLSVDHPTCPVVQDTG